MTNSHATAQALKRVRRDSDVSEATSVYTSVTIPKRTRDAVYWYKDGNIILVARNVDFRVFRGILADHSPVFDAMLSLPQPVEFAPSVGNPNALVGVFCPVLQLSDSPEDLRHILRMCIPKNGFSPYTFEAPSYDMVSAVTRLGHKYQMSKLIDSALGYLKRFYTDKLDVWEKGRSYNIPGFAPSHPIGVVNLARLVDEPSLLPTALLQCCSLGADIVKGFTREDGTHEQLSLEDIGRCFAARTILAERAILMIFRAFSLPVSEQCKTPGRCAEGLHALLMDLQNRVESVSHPDIFSSLFDSDGEKDRVLECADCDSMLRQREKKLRREAWDLLPSIMGVQVDGWGTSVL
ncbi:hypothetical protein OH77DRAFT_1411475 [Trametes cingulata]|nr:hypothetical protein OH77DRAFT_1411475 [Trametes cingulata]